MANRLEGGPIAAYLAEHGAIKARWVDYCQRDRAAEQEADAAGVEPVPPDDYDRIQYTADLVACEVRHFGLPLPNTGERIDSEPRLWRWIKSELFQINASLDVASRIASTFGPLGPPDPYRQALLFVYHRMHVGAMPGAPRPPYPPMTEDEARDELQRIANDLQAREPPADFQPMRWFKANTTIKPTTLRTAALEKRVDSRGEGEDKLYSIAGATRLWPKKMDPPSRLEKK